MSVLANVAGAGSGIAEVASSIAQSALPINRAVVCSIIDELSDNGPIVASWAIQIASVIGGLLPPIVCEGAGVAVGIVYIPTCFTL